MRILLSGASGFIGKSLASYLISAGHSVVPLPHGKISLDSSSQDFEHFDAYIHLSGESVFGRWTESKRSKILESRLATTRILSQIISQLKHPPKIFISASGVGFYGDRGEEILDEKSPCGNGFLSQVCSEWEKESRPIEKKGIRTIHARFGMVLGREGGALAAMLASYKRGLGGRIGSGRQWVSWVDLADLNRAIEFILLDSSIQGAVNIVSPHPVRQEELSKTLAGIVHRPRLLYLPAWAVRLLFGQMGEELFLSSARALPAKLLAKHFSFQSPFLRDALLKAID